MAIANIDISVTPNAVLKAAKAKGFAGSDSDTTAQLSFIAEKKFIVPDPSNPSSRVEVLGKSFKITQPSDTAVLIEWADGEVQADGKPDYAPADPEAKEEMAKALKGLKSEISSMVAMQVADGIAKAAKSQPAFEVGRDADERMYDDMVEDDLQYKNPADRRRAFKTAKRAAEFGALLVLKACPHSPELLRSEGATKAWKSMQESGAVKKDMALTPGSVGVLAGTTFSPDIIRLFQTYGVASRFANVQNATDVEFVQFQETTETLPYAYPLENGTLTVTDNAYVRLTSKMRTLAMLGKASLQAQRYALINLGDSMAKSFARTGAFAEDNNVFNGTGTNTGATPFGGCVGLAGRFAQVGLTATVATTAAGATNVNLTGTSAGQWSDYTLTHFTTLMGLSRDYGDDNANKWYCHKRFYNQVMKSLAWAAGGVMAAEIFNGGGKPTFDGREVVFTQVMNATASTGATTVDCYYGDLNRGVNLIRGTNMQIDVDLSRGFDTLSVFYRAMLDHDTQVTHGVGSLTLAGSVNALFQV